MNPVSGRHPIDNRLGCPLSIQGKSIRSYIPVASRAISASSGKYCRAVSMPASSNAVSMDETSLFHLRSPVLTSTQ
jgi:hypothetical protein